MSDACMCTVGATFLLAVTLLCNWRTIRSLNCLSVFVVTHIVFVLMGVLLFPWVSPYLGYTYRLGSSNLDLGAMIPVEVFDSEDCIRAIILTVGGLVITVASYQATAALTQRPARYYSNTGRQRLPTESAHHSGFSRTSLRVLSVTTALVVLGLLLSKADIVFSGLKNGLLAGQHEEYILSRLEMSKGGFILYVLCCNVLPFLAASEWMMTKAEGARGRMYVPALMLLTIFGMLLLFQKRPLVVFLATLALIDYMRRLQPFRGAHTSAGRASTIRLWRFALHGLCAFTVLMVLYAATTNVVAEGDSLVESVLILFLISATRVLGRLSIPAICYSHYFPRVDDHYALSNIGLLSKVCGFPLYGDTGVVYDYFTGKPGGSLACCALMDFYGGFGWTGWLIGCIALGALLQRLDESLRAISPNPSKAVAAGFAMVFTYYLSQASLSRSLWGYGGIFFLMCWVLTADSGNNRRYRNAPNGSRIRGYVAKPRRASMQGLRTS